jgi:hypothetical protein
MKTVYWMTVGGIDNRAQSAFDTEAEAIRDLEADERADRVLMVTVEHVVKAEEQDAQPPTWPVEIIRELDGFNGRACLVRRADRYFVVSSTDAFGTGFETLIFPADANGEVASWGEVGGGRGMSREKAIADFAELGPYYTSDEEEE